MKIKVNLKNIIDGKFKYYLNDNYKDAIFSILKEKYKDWRIVAKKLEVNTTKSSTIKYDIILPCNFKNKVKFINDCLFPYINHKKKIERFKSLKRKLLK